MPSDFSASIKLLYIVKDGMYFPIDDIINGSSFDVIANVDIGQDLYQNVDNFDLWVSVLNLSQLSVLGAEHVGGVLIPSTTSFNDEVRVDFDSGWNANVGDVLRAMASFKVTAGANFMVSTAQSSFFVVT
jgi:hypothetical protein